MITAEKNRRRGKANSVKASIDKHIEWLEQQLKEIESQIKSAIAKLAEGIAVNDNWKQKMKVREGEVASPSLITLLDLLTSVPGIDERPRVVLRRKGTRELAKS